MPIVTEGVTLDDVTVEVIAWLQTCYDLMEAGEEIRCDPFYKRSKDRSPWTDDEVSRLIGILDSEFAFEIGTYAGYHRNRSGATHTPDFSRLSAQSQRALIEHTDEILSRHKRLKTQEPDGPT